MKLILIFFSLCIFSFPFFAKDKPKKTSNPSKNISGNWSEYQGEFNSYAASDKCRSIGMRIPTLKEWKFAFNSGKMKGWESGLYWIETEPSDGNFLAVINGEGGVVSNKEGIRHLRCIL
ncbi:MAG TPA: hypothetical protein PK079_14040 [Leptospiraceae bacterium]|nr:hypothetical protein [Leptospiraceae bacterium]HMW08494.1 hypothetical protein [Leptospiraceae bacterium]HMX33334.1 hypothetical protein [Leptospiraceae bacterium]HMY34079.1 hypothetical protein [Leptospiraceae bacterium]HMZ64596.1 hypothetical protein [Leptospiraceae bacterium]